MKRRKVLPAHHGVNWQSCCSGVASILAFEPVETVVHYERNIV